MPARLLSVFLGVLSLQATAADRQTVEGSGLEEERSESTNSSAECTEAIRAVYRTISSRDLFSPILDGTYTIRNRYSSKYLTLSPDGHVGTSLHHVDSSRFSDWRLNRVLAPGQPVFTVQNRHSTKYLAVQNGALAKLDAIAPEAHWRLVLAPDGIHRTIVSNAEPLRLMSNGSCFVALEESQGSGNTRSAWLLDLRLSWLRWPQGDQAAYAAQWNSVKTIPLFSGTHYTWEQLCQDAEMENECPQSYATQRSRAKLEGISRESHRRVVMENLHRGACDTEWGVAAWVFKLAPNSLRAIRSVAGQACASQSFAGMNNLLKEAVTQECYAGCLTDIRGHIEAVQQNPCGSAANDTFWHGLAAKESCASLPSESVEKLASYVFMEMCWTWHPPSPMWIPDLREKWSLKVADDMPVCSVPIGKESWRSSVAILQAGVCPSGSTCQCPKSWIHKELSSIEMQAGMDVFVEKGVSLKAFIDEAIFQAQIMVGFNIVLGGMTIVQALAALPSFGLVMAVAMPGYNFASNVLQFTCSDTVACWPLSPQKQREQETKNACRMKREAKAGGSVMWFMPPPGVVIKHSKSLWFIHRCNFVTCGKAEWLEQKIGFFRGAAEPASVGTPSIYNCQPLVYEDMTQEQQELYIARVQETVPDEFRGEFSAPLQPVE